MKKVLIANRGEIALRVMRACKELNIETVLIYSKADKGSKLLSLADHSINIGPESSSLSYLNKENVLSSCVLKGVDGVHPGYGFLSENYYFANLCEKLGITFIGPNSDIIKLMGDKSSARQVAIKAGVPVIPGSNSTVINPYLGLEIAKKIGFPVIIKANGGGGGKGMRLVHSKKTFFKDFYSASNEASKAFNDGRVYVEKYIKNPRHIEVQVLGDSQGNLIHLWERDCSVQRKYQKVIEEGPCFFINKKTRYKITEAALAVARECKYFSAGTVEFLVNETGKFFFIEMNTRLQVEHGVTELATGIDIVKEQIKVAYGAKLNLIQKNIKIINHVIECRVNAEEPLNKFYSSPGKVKLYLPSGGPNIRIESHIYTGYEIPPHYDSMVMKILAYSQKRCECVKSLIRALSELKIGGVRTNISFCIKILKSNVFTFKGLTTNYIDNSL